jgi:hypothetical protein
VIEDFVWHGVGIVEGRKKELCEGAILSGHPDYELGHPKLLLGHPGELLGHPWDVPGPRRTSPFYQGTLETANY